MKKMIAVILSSLSLSGCGMIHAKYTPQIVIVAPAPHVHAPPIPPPQVSAVQWNVYDENGLKGVLANASKTGQKVVLFTLDEANFKLLNGNLAAIKGYIQQQKAAIQFLDKAANAPADAADAAAAAAKDGQK